MTLQLYLGFSLLVILSFAGFILLRYQKRKKKSDSSQNEIPTPAIEVDRVQSNGTDVAENKIAAIDIAPEQLAGRLEDLKSIKNELRGVISSFTSIKKTGQDKCPTAVPRPSFLHHAIDAPSGGNTILLTGNKNIRAE